MTNTPTPVAAAKRYDAFVSYSHADRRTVRRIQRFVERYQPPGRRDHLVLFVDDTDLRGGPLPDSLRSALEASAALIVCWSPQASASAWVKQEVALFRQLGREGRILIVHVAGRGPKADDASFAGLEPLEHDLRRGWRLAWLRPAARIELLRVIAFLTDVDLRSLHDWARRRALRNASIVAAAALLPALGLLGQRVPDWQRVPVAFDDSPTPAFACDVQHGRLWLLAWAQQVGETSGANAYFLATPQLGVQPLQRLGAPRFELPRRALPKRWLAGTVSSDVEQMLDASGLRDRLARLEPKEVERFARPRPGHLLVVIPQSRPAPGVDELKAQARDRLPIPETAGAWVASYAEGQDPVLVKVDGLAVPRWTERTRDRWTSPSRALSIAWQSDGEIWIGVPGERDVAGGLWHSADRGTHWRKVEGFDSVSSLELRMGSGKELLVVADQSFARVQGDMRAPSRSRVAQRGPQGNWVDSDAPPHGGESEIELCGTRSDGVRHIRVDGTIYRETSRSLFSAWLAPRVPASDAIR